MGPRLRQFAFAGDPVFVLAHLYAKPMPKMRQRGVCSRIKCPESGESGVFKPKKEIPGQAGNDKLGSENNSLSIRNAPVSGKKQGHAAL